jgi:hypothetical protein
MTTAHPSDRLLISSGSSSTGAGSALPILDLAHGDADDSSQLAQAGAGQGVGNSRMELVGKVFGSDLRLLQASMEQDDTFYIG